MILVFSGNNFAKKTERYKKMQERHRKEMRELQETQRKEMRELQQEERTERIEQREKKRQEAYDDIKTLFYDAIDKGKSFDGKVMVSIKRGKKEWLYENNKGKVTKKGMKKAADLKKMISYMLKKDTKFDGAGRMTFDMKKKKSSIKVAYKNKDGAVSIQYNQSGHVEGYSLNSSKYSSTSVRSEMKSYWRAGVNWMKSWWE